MKSDIETDPLHPSANQDLSAQRLAIGMHGLPELKEEEKNNYLGEFRERIIRRLTKKQVTEKNIYPEIKEALIHKKSSKMLIDGTLSPLHTNKYIELARQVKKPYTKIYDPELTGETGLVVISDEAVDIEDIDIHEASSS